MGNPSPGNMKELNRILNILPKAFSQQITFPEGIDQDAFEQKFQIGLDSWNIYLT